MIHFLILLLAGFAAPAHAESYSCDHGGKAVSHTIPQGKTLSYSSRRPGYSGIARIFLPTIGVGAVLNPAGQVIGSANWDTKAQRRFTMYVGNETSSCGRVIPEAQPADEGYSYRDTGFCYGFRSTFPTCQN